MGKTINFSINKYAVKRNERPDAEFYNRKSGAMKHKLDKRQQNKMQREMREAYD